MLFMQLEGLELLETFLWFFAPQQRQISLVFT